MMQWNKIRKQSREWSRWFAWYPVCVKQEDGIREMVWLEWIERDINCLYRKWRKIGSSEYYREDWSLGG